MLRRALPVLGMLLGLSSHVGAQDARAPRTLVEFSLRPALSGIKRLAVEVVLSAKGEPACEITEDRLRLAASRSLLDGGIGVPPKVDAQDPGYLFVSVIPLETAVCSAYVAVGVEVVGFMTLPALAATDLAPVGGRKVMSMPVAIGPYQLVEEATLLIGPRSDFAQRVTDAVRDFTDRIVTKIKLANQQKE